MRYLCIRCSTIDNPVFVNPIEKDDGYLHCHICNGIELEEVE